MQSETRDQDSTGAPTSIDAISDAGEEAARLSKINADIKTVSSLLVGFSPEDLGKKASAINDKEDIPEALREWLMLTTSLESLVKERGEILEKRRVQDTIQETENMDGWSPTESASWDICPICLEIPRPNIHDGNKFNGVHPCCGTMTCTPCFRDLERSFLLRDEYMNCPMCRQDFPKSEEEANELVNARADKGMSWAQVHVGRGLERAGDLQSALHWYKLAAEQGDANALYNLGRLHHLGLSALPQSNTEAKQCFLASAKQGHALAQYELGMILLDESVGPEGQQAEEVEALRLFTLSAAQGCGHACFTLGLMHYEGFGGFERSLELALYWHLNAARARNGDEAMAQYQVADLLLEIASKWYGENDITGYSAVPKALHWLREAADQGNEDAKQKVGELVRSAKGKGCGGCGKPLGPDVSTKECANCKGAFYCSKECQEIHWERGHEKDCVVYGC